MPNLIVKKVSKKNIRELNRIAKYHKMNLNQYLKLKIKIMIESEIRLNNILNRSDSVSKFEVAKILRDERKKRHG